MVNFLKTEGPAKSNILATAECMTEDLFSIKGKFVMRPYEKGCSDVLIFTRSEEAKKVFRSLHLKDVEE